MRVALLVTDLEGVAGVDGVEPLLAGSPSYPRAKEFLTGEVNAAVEGLRRGGFEIVRVSDSHRAAGGPNLRRGELHPAARLVQAEDAYAPELFDGVSAVACLGMHAPAGSLGFAAHTVAVHCAWSAGRRALSELDLILALAAERRLPAVFASGDDALERHARGVRFVRTKRALSIAEARSMEPEQARVELMAAAGRPPLALPPPPRGPLRLSFKSRWQADLAQQAGGERVGECSVRISGASFGERYRRALEVLAPSEEVLGGCLRGSAGDPDFCEDVLGLLSREFERKPTRRAPGAARAALRAFLGCTDGAADWQRALRALVLHMLEAHAPGFFRAQRLRSSLESALSALAEVPQSFPPELEPSDVMARLDALYLLGERSSLSDAGAGELRRYLRALLSEGEVLYAWLLAQLAREVGLGRAAPRVAERVLRKLPRDRRAYWLTHRFFLATGYLRAPLERSEWGAAIEEALLAASWAVEHAQVDLAAELALCLQAAGESRSAEHRALLELLRRHQRPDGWVEDPTSREEARDEADLAEMDAHTTAVALLAFAGL
ncbi:MAG: M55 family metallopeptidase [Myxococcales bacterium]|nr:M55 family metallopeptidase [Myxococcales bacterium]